MVPLTTSHPINSMARERQTLNFTSLYNVNNERRSALPKGRNVNVCAASEFDEVRSRSRAPLPKRTLVKRHVMARGGQNDQQVEQVSSARSASNAAHPTLIFSTCLSCLAAGFDRIPEWRRI